ncbi:MAG: ATP-binding protein [Nostoc sp.]
MPRSRKFDETTTGQALETIEQNTRSLARLIERQADSSSTRSHGGLGLGLAIVRHLVELHGGTVSAESLGIGQGATFIVNLPMKAVYVEANTAEALSSPCPQAS